MLTIFKFIFSVLKELDREYEKKKREKLDELKSFLQQNRDNLYPSQEFYDFCYWETDLSIQMVAESLGMTSNSFCQHVTKPHTIILPCVICEEDVPISISTRSEIEVCKKEHKKTDINDKYFDAIKNRYVCAKCKTKEEQIRAEKEKESLDKLRYMRYDKYLKTKHWRNVRHLALEYAHFRCQLCNRGNTKLNVHHRTYIHKGQEQDYLEDLIVLCQDCHKRFHDKIERR